MTKSALSYRDSGVSRDFDRRLSPVIERLAKRTHRSGASAFTGGFAGIFDIGSAGFDDPLLLLATDGVGTKLALASLAPREGSRCQKRKHILMTLGTDLVAMCVNDVLAQGGTPLCFLDMISGNALSGSDIESVLEGVVGGCLKADCALTGGETAQMPLVYNPGELDLAGFCMGAAERSDLLPHRDIMVPDDVIVALPSDGVHANGFSMIHAIVGSDTESWEAAAPFTPTGSLLSALATPTRIYVKPVLALRKRLALAGRSNSLRAIAHITGGGIPGNLARVIPDKLCARIECNRLPRHPVFPWIAQSGPVEREEMFETFNMGTGLILIISRDSVGEVVECLEEFDECPVEVGRLDTRTSSGAVVDLLR